MSEKDFTLYAYTFRSRAEGVLWALREFNYPHKVIRLDPLKGDTNKPEFLSLNPSKKIPVLTHEDKAFTESLAIMEYLNDISSDFKLIPNTPLDAFNYRKIIHYGITEIESYVWIAEQATTLKSLYDWPQGTYESAVKLVKQNIELVWQWLEQSKFIASENFTLADIYYYYLIIWSHQHGIHTPQSQTQRVQEYLKKLEERRAFPGSKITI